MLRILAVFLSLFLFVAPALAEPLRVVASFSILGDMVKTVGGEAVEVGTLVGPDADAHSYQPTPEDMKRLAGAKLVFMNGLGFEGWMKRLVESSGTKAKVITVSEGVKARAVEEAEEEEEHEGHDHHGLDPHAWQDAANARLYVKNIAAALESALPDHVQAIRARAAAYDAELAKLDADIRAQFAAIPQDRRKIITSHDAFGYFGAAYGIAFLAPQGMSAEAEASPSDIAKLIRQIRTEGVRKIFLENMADPRLIKQMAKDSGATLGGTLYADALSAPNGPAPSYGAMMRYNAGKMLGAMRE